MKVSYSRVRFACYSAGMTMSVVGNLPPLLFLSFRSLYGISYSLLGLLVLLNYCTQLAVDLVFSFFSHRFNIPRAVKFTPVMAVAGLLLYALWPVVFPGAVYVGLMLGTVIFSASAGFAEVLMSPVIAAIPAKDPDREMSKLHSVYAWGSVGVVLLSTLFLLVAGAAYWPWLAAVFALIPLISAIAFAGSTIPPMETPEKASGALGLLKNKGVWLCVLAIFLGGAAECNMNQWASGYLEQAMGIPKVWGDVFGVALFGVMLGLGRTLYGKYGKNMEKVLLLCGISATVCYLVAALSPWPVVGLLACALTGFCTSMLWPGNLVIAAERVPVGGVFIFALMAAGGDLGASVAPQLVGIITDLAIENPAAVALADTLGILPEQLGMKLGLLAGMLFPLAGIFVYGYFYKTRKKAG